MINHWKKTLDLRYVWKLAVFWSNSCEQLCWQPYWPLRGIRRLELFPAGRVNHPGALGPSQKSNVLVAVLLFICSFLCHSCNFSSSFESFLAISVAWDQAPHWGKKEKNYPVFAFFLHCGALSQATISFALSVACRNFIDSVYRGPQGKTACFLRQRKAEKSAVSASRDRLRERHQWEDK